MSSSFPSRSALRFPTALLRAATVASADSSLRLLLRRPFRHAARSPQVRTRSFPAQPPDLRRLSLDHKSFAEHCPLALLGTALYPVLVHRLAVSLHASFPHSVALMQLRFASLTVVSLQEDLHLQDRAHAGRTTVQIVASHDLTLVVSHFLAKYLRPLQRPAGFAEE